MIFGKKHNEEEEKESQSSGKKLLILYVLEVLKKYSSERRKLTQSEIIEHIKNDFGAECERKAVGRNIRSLIEYGYDIVTYEQNGEGYYIRTHELSDEDAFILYEGLVSSRYSEDGDVSRLLGYISKYSETPLEIGKNFFSFYTMKSEYPKGAVLENLKILNKAMNEGHTIKCFYNTLDENKELIALTDEKEELSPHAVVNVDNTYYLAASRAGETALSAFRAALLSDIEITSNARADSRKFAETSRKGIMDVQLFARNFVSGYGGDEIDCKIKVAPEMVYDTVELFGDGASLVSKDESGSVFALETNYDRVFDFAFHNPRTVEILEPAALRFKLKDFFDVMSIKYR